MRIIGCVKDGRLKKKLDDETEIKLEDLKNSLISFCKFSTNLYEKNLKLFETFEINISHEVKQYIDSFITERYNGIFKIHNAVEVNQNTIINLKRLKPAFCHICNKIHDHENAYISVFNDNFSFVCRRNSTMKSSIGSFNMNTIKQDEEEYPDKSFVGLVINQQNKKQTKSQSWYNTKDYD